MGLQMWYRQTSDIAGVRGIGSLEGGLRFYIGVDGGSFDEYLGGHGNRLNTQSGFTGRAEYFAMAQYFDGSTAYLKVDNGTPVSGASNAGMPTAREIGVTGRDASGGISPTGDGDYDEVRVRRETSNPTPAQWDALLDTEYNNFTAPGTFYTATATATPKPEIVQRKIAVSANALTLDTAPTPGNVFVVFYADNSNDPSSVVTPAGSWTTLHQYNSGGSEARQANLAVFAKEVEQGDSGTFNMLPSSANRPVLCVCEIANASTHWSDWVGVPG